MLDRSHVFSIKVNKSYVKAIKDEKKALNNDGFEIVSEINFSDIINERLSIKVKKYLILEILNSFIAYQSLLTVREAGLFVPYRIAIFEDNDGNITISLLNPEQTAGITENMVLKLIAGDEWEKLRNTISTLQHSI